MGKVINDEIKNNPTAYKEAKKQAKKDGIILYKMYGNLYARMMSTNVKNPQTVIQQSNRKEFKRTQKLASRLLKIVIHQIWHPYAKSLNNPLKKFSGYTLFIHMNKSFIKEDSIDYKSLIISFGSVPAAKSPKVTKEEEKLCITWENETTSPGYDNDIVRIVAFDEEFDNVYSLPDDKARRKDCKCYMSIPEEDKRLYLYIYFEAVDKEGKSLGEYSNSVYVSNRI